VINHRHIPELPPAKYDLAAKSPGFGKVKDSIRYRVDLPRPQKEADSIGIYNTNHWSRKG
jgi:hypothetical protein